jgi:hypothetical protein
MKTKLVELLQRYVAPSVLGVITIDSYRRQVHSHQKELLNIKQNSNTELSKLQQELWGDKIVNSEFKTKLEACSNRINEVNQEILNINNKLNSNNLYSNTNMKTYYNNELSRLNTQKNDLVKELQEVINKSDVSGFIKDFIETYKNFVDQLSLEQLVALFNIIGFLMIFFTLISITTLLIGDYLIEKFKLNDKYPKIYKYIKFKQTLNKHYMMFYFIIFYIIVIVYILANFYMLLIKYFI